jgi:hypothetical protein
MDVVDAMSSEHRFAHRRASPSFVDVAGEPFVHYHGPRVRRDIVVLTKGTVVDPLAASLRDELVTRGIPWLADIAGQLTAKRRQ